MPATKLDDSVRVVGLAKAIGEHGRQEGIKQAPEDEALCSHVSETGFPFASHKDSRQVKFRKQVPSEEPCAAENVLAAKR